MVTNPASPHVGQRRRLLRRWQHRSRFVVSAAIFFAAFALALAGGLKPARALLCAFDLGAVVYLITISMTFQVSDVQIADGRLRRLALMHSVIAFFFGVIIIALTVNIVAGSAG